MKNKGQLVFENQKTKIYRHSDGERTSIIKVLGINHPNEFESAKFLHEYKVLSKFQHPNIIKVYKVGRHDLNVAFWLEDISGTSLDRIDLPLSVEDFFKVSLKLTSAIAEIHKQGFIHKDINPSNIIVDNPLDQVRVIDFGIATNMVRENQNLGIEQIEGTWAYISPEQTGRVPVPLDYRTDFYALGLTFYELLTGEKPFHGEDCLDWFSEHMSSKVPLTRDKNPDIPIELDQIISKLSEKMPDLRYQSSYGLLYDLEQCKKIFHGKSSEVFKIGIQDFHEKFIIPDKNYGRKDEIIILNKNIEHLGDRTQGVDLYKPLVFISGTSGIGKSYLVKELLPSITGKKGILAWGKFDATGQNIGFIGIKSALTNAMREAVSLSPDLALKMIEDMKLSLSECIPFITHFLPDLQNQLGSNTEVVQGEGIEAKMRIFTSISAYVNVFVRYFPLVLSIDDVQWADDSSVELLTYIIQNRKSNKIIIIAIYRSDDIDSNHPLFNVMDQFTDEFISIQLNPFTRESIKELLQESLNQREVSPEICDLLIKRTGGNPFFIRQILNDLYENGYIKLDRKSKAWCVDTNAIFEMSVSQNVVDFLVHKFSEFSQSEKQVLVTAACIGHEFDLIELSEGLEIPINETLKVLTFLIEEQIIGADDPNYKYTLEVEKIDEACSLKLYFLHDKLQVSALNLLSASELDQIYIKLAFNLYSKKSEKDILKFSQYLLSVKGKLGEDILIKSAENWADAIAICVSENSIQYALNCVEFVMTNMPDGLMDLQYDVWHKIQKLIGKVYFISGKNKERDLHYKDLIARLRNPNHMAEIYEIWAYQCIHNLDFKSTYTYSSAGLELLGFNTKFSIIRLILSKIAYDKSIKYLKNNQESYLETKIEKEHILLIRLTSFLAVSLLLDKAKILHGLMMVYINTSKKIKLGCSPSIEHVYGLNIGLSSILENWSRMRFFLDFGEKLVSKYKDNKNFVSYIKYNGYLYGYHYFIPHKKLAPDLKEIALEGEKCGELLATLGFYDFIYVGFNYERLQYLKSQISDARRFYTVLNDHNNIHQINILGVFIDWLADPNSDPLETEAFWSSNKDWQSVVQSKQETEIHNIYGLMLRYYFICSEFKASLNMSAICSKYEDGTKGTFGHFLNRSFRYISYIPFLKRNGLKNIFRIRNLVNFLIDKVTYRKLSKMYPDNFMQFEMFQKAQMADFLRKPAEKVATTYMKAFELAKKDQNICLQAIILEHLGSFYFSRNMNESGCVVIEQSIKYFEKWGAFWKVTQLSRQYADKLDNSIWATFKENFTQKNTSTSNISSTETFSFKETAKIKSGSVDFIALIKSSRSMSSEVNIEKLSYQITSISCKLTGADFGCLLLDINQKYYLYSTFQKNQQTLIKPRILDESMLIIEVVKAAKINLKAAVMNMNDIQSRSKSSSFDNQRGALAICAIPIINKGELVAILYLESSSHGDFFSHQMLETLEIIASQAAVSIGNSRAFTHIEEIVSQRTAELREKSKDIESILTNVHQGIFTISDNLKIDPQYSPFLEEILEQESIAGDTIDEIFFKHSNLSEQELGTVKSILRCTGESSLEFMINSHLLPNRMNYRSPTQDKILDINWSIVEEDGLIEKFLVSVRDVTSLHNLQKDLDKQNEDIEILSVILKCGLSNFAEFRTDSIEQLNECLSNNSEESIIILCRLLHTIKGNSQLLKLVEFSDLVHQVEQYYIDVREEKEAFNVGLSKEKINLVIDLLNYYDKVIGKYIRDSDMKSMDHQAFVEHLKNFAKTSVNNAELIKFNDILHKASESYNHKGYTTLAIAFKPVLDSIPSFCASLDKKAANVVFVGDSIKVPSTMKNLIKNVSSHLIKNSLDHGIESSSERLSCGKPEAGTITIEASKDGGLLTIIIKDDGRGLNLTKLRKIGISKKSISEVDSDEKVAMLIFESNLSTAQKVDQISGRGVGMDAVKAFLEEEGGSIDIQFLTNPDENGFRQFQFLINIKNIQEYKTAS